jgi:hypothetical protein
MQLCASIRATSPTQLTVLNLMSNTGILMNLRVVIYLFVVYLTTLSVARTV